MASQVRKLVICLESISEIKKLHLYAKTFENRWEMQVCLRFVLHVHLHTVHAGDSGCAARLFVNTTIDYCFFSCRSEKHVSRWFVGMKLHKLKDKSKGLDISPAVTSFKGISKYWDQHCLLCRIIAVNCYTRLTAESFCV